MTLDIRQILAIALLGVVFLLPTEGGSGGGGVKPSITVSLPTSGIPAGRRQYFGDIYDSMALVIERDGKRADPGIDSTDDFTKFQAAALQLAVDREQVGVYPGLGEAIDRAFLDNLGDESQNVDAAVRAKLAEVCRAIAWGFKNG